VTLWPGPATFEVDGPVDVWVANGQVQEIQGRPCFRGGLSRAAKRAGLTVCPTLLASLPPAPRAKAQRGNPKEDHVSDAEASDYRDLCRE
jgi:hypothetical protein